MKTNQMFVRKCQSTMPRLENREFRMVLEADRHLAVVNIKASSSKQLTVLFEAMQQFFIDHDFAVAPIVTGGDDLLIRFSHFQLKHGQYAGCDRYELLRSVVNEFWHYEVVKKGTMLGRNAMTKQEDHNYVASRAGLSERAVCGVGGQQFVLRKYLPISKYTGPEKDYGSFLTIPLGNWPLTSGFRLEDCKDEQVVVMNYMQFAEDTTLAPGCVGYGVTVPYFIEMLRARGYTASDVSILGGFTVSKA